MRVRARAARCSVRTPPAPALIAAAREPPACAPGRARNSHEHQRSQGVSGPEGNPAAFRGRGLGLAERTGGSGRASPGLGVRGRSPSHLADAGHGSEGACGSLLARLPRGSCLSGGLRGPCRKAGLRSLHLENQISVFEQGSGSRLPPAHPSHVDPQDGRLAAAGRALPGRGSGQVGTLAPSSQQGLGTGNREPESLRAPRVGTPALTGK